MVKKNNNTTKITGTVKINKKLAVVSGVTGAAAVGAFATKRAYDIYIKNLIQNTVDKIKNQPL